MTILNHPVDYSIKPISINQDGSISATITLSIVTNSVELKGDASKVAQQSEKEYSTIGQSHHYISAADSTALLQIKTNKDETINDALERVIVDCLRSRGEFKF